MGRIIKFRGKTETNFPDNKGNILIPKDKWIYGGIVYDVDRVWIDMPYYGQILVNKETVGQYTGLKDENEVEIYEGDIVLITRPCILEKGEVKFINGCFAIKSKDTLLMLYQCEINNFKLEIIGNIYDNPELLRAGD